MPEILLLAGLFLLYLLTRKPRPDTPTTAATPQPAPQPPQEPTIEMDTAALERYKNLRYAMIEAETREFVRYWEGRMNAGQITPTEFEDMVNRLLDEGLLKSAEYSYRPERKF